MNSRNSNPFASSVSSSASRVSEVSNPTTFSTSRCEGLFFSDGTTSSSRRNDSARASALSRCEPWRVNG